MKDISFLIDFHIWANDKAIQEIQTLTEEEWNKDLGGSFPSPKLVCQHLIGADYRWLQRWNGIPIADIPATLMVETPAQLSEVWQPMMDEMKTASNLFKGDIEKPVFFITAKGAKFTMPFWQTLHHTVNHGTYHRGQITNMMRMLGKTPISTDMFLFFVERGG